MNFRRHIAPLCGYLFLTVVMTWPVAWNLDGAIIGAHMDAYQNLWNLWWWKRALLVEHTNPYFTDMLHYPDGTSLLFHTLSPFNGVLSIPMQSVFSLVATYNLLNLFGFFATGFTMYLLAYHLTKSRCGAFLAGVILSFSPHHAMRGLGHLNLVSIEWLPPAILFLLRLKEKPTRTNLLGLIGFAVLNALCSWHNAFHFGAFVLLFLLYHWWLEGSTFLRSAFLGRLGMAFLGVLLCLSPWILSSLLRSHLFELKANVFSADLISFVTPPWILSWGRDGWEAWRTGFDFEPYLHANYLGMVTLAVVSFSFFKKEHRFWSLMAVVFALLALGPTIRFRGEELVAGPDRVFREFLPIYSLERAPDRFVILCMLALAVLAAFSVKRWQEAGRKPWLCLLPTALVCLEFLPLPYPTLSAEVPSFYRQMAVDGDTYAVLDRSDANQYYATIHEKPLVGGYISRKQKSSLQFLRNHPVLHDLIGGLNWPMKPTDREVRELQALGIRYIITESRSKAPFFIEPVYYDTRVTVYAVEDFVSAAAPRGEVKPEQ